MIRTVISGLSVLLSPDYPGPLLSDHASPHDAAISTGRADVHLTFPVRSVRPYCRLLTGPQLLAGDRRRARRRVGPRRRRVEHRAGRGRPCQSPADPWTPGPLEPWNGRASQVLRVPFVSTHSALEYPGVLPSGVQTPPGRVAKGSCLRLKPAAASSFRRSGPPQGRIGRLI